VTRGDLYRTRARVAERGGKPGFYVVVSRAFVAESDDIATVVCAPVYSRVLGLSTEVVLEPQDGVPHTSAIRCDFLTLMFKEKLTTYVASLSRSRVADFDRALAMALDLPAVGPGL
jgi:mRNA interferase MazF